MNYSISLDDPPIEGLFSGCALGILHNDMQLAQLVLQEFKEHETNSVVVHHIAFLTSQFYLKNVIREKLCHWSHKLIFLFLILGTNEEGPNLPFVSSTYSSRQYDVTERSRQLFTFKLQKIA